MESLGSAVAAGLVLAGGRGQRLGRTKADLVFRGRTLLERTLDTLAAAGLEPRVVVAAAGQALPSLPPRVERIDDRVAGRGPLQALADGLAHLRALDRPVVAVACDMPFLTPSFVRRIVAALGDARGVVPVDGDGRAHPLAGVYRCALEEDLRARLAQGERRTGAVLELAGVRALPVASGDEGGAHPDPLTNVNRPEDLERALARAADAPDRGDRGGRMPPSR